MDTYYTVIVSATFSVFLIFAASTITLLRHSEQPTVTHNDNINSVAAKITVKDENAVKPKLTLGQSVYKSSVLHKYRKKFSRKLELASDQRKKVCGIYVKYSVVDCSVCTLFFGGLQFLAERGSTQEDVADFSKLVCINLKIADERVCSSITQEFKVIRVMRNIGVAVDNTQMRVFNICKVEFAHCNVFFLDGKIYIW